MFQTVHLEPFLTRFQGFFWLISVVCIAAFWRDPLPCPPLQIFKEGFNVVFNAMTHTPHFLHLFNKNTPQKKVYKETTYTLFHDNFKTKILISLKTPSITQFGMPKKMTPKSKAKINTPFP